MRDTTTWENHAYTQPRVRRCITPRCPLPAVSGRSRCSRHGPVQTKAIGPNPYDYAHQQDRRRVAESGALTCGICGLSIMAGEPWHLDHVLPISLGGRNGPKQPTHQDCNIRKGGSNRLSKS